MRELYKSFWKLICNAKTAQNHVPEMCSTDSTQKNTSRTIYTGPNIKYFANYRCFNI